MEDAQIPPEGMQAPCSRCGFEIKVRPRRLKTGQLPSLAAPEEPGDKTPPDAEVVEDAAAATAEMPAAREAQPPRPASARPKAATGARAAVSQAPARAEPEPQRVAQAPTPEADGEVLPGPRASRPDAPGQAVNQVEDEFKAAAGEAAARVRASLGRGLPFAGIIRSGERFRFRDLFYALRAPLDVRKLAATSAGVLLGCLLLLLLSWLGSLTKTMVGVMAGAILGGLFLWACTYLGLAVATRQVDREARAGRRLPIAEGLDYVKKRWLTVLGAPLVFVAAVLVLGAGIALFHLLARVPYAGPLVYGLAFLLVFALAFLAVLVLVLLGLITFTYLPASEGLGPLGVIRRVGSVLTRRPGWYLLYWAIAGAVSSVLGWLLIKLVHRAFGFISLVDGWVGGGEVSRILLSLPAGFGALIELISPTGLGAAAGSEWQFSVAGWLVAVGMLALLSLVAGFVLTYFHAAGVAAYRLLEPEAGKEP
jgi:hypothetical protein